MYFLSVGEEIRMKKSNGKIMEPFFIVFQGRTEKRKWSSATVYDRIYIRRLVRALRLLRFLDYKILL